MFICCFFRINLLFSFLLNTCYIQFCYRQKAGDCNVLSIMLLAGSYCRGLYFEIFTKKRLVQDQSKENMVCLCVKHTREADTSVTFPVQFYI